MIITKKMALRDPILGTFIDRASRELEFSGKFMIEKVIKDLNCQIHRTTIYMAMRAIRGALEDRWNKLTPITYGGQLAGKGRASEANGYVRICKEHKSLVDESNLKRVGMCNGLKNGHNIIAEELSEETGEPRAMLAVELLSVTKDADKLAIT